MTTSADKVTVIIPTRDRAALATRAVGSALAQVGVDVEVVVIDDGSNDETAASLAALTRDNVTVLRHPVSKGLSAARNAGVAASRSRWIAFCDDDDLWAPTKLQAQLAALDSTTGARWSTVGVVAVDDDLTVLGAQRPPASGDVAALLLGHNAVPAGGSTVVAERALLDEAGGFDVDLPRVEDYDCWIRLAQSSPVATVDAPLAAYRTSVGTMSYDIDGMQHCLAVIADRYGLGTDPAAARAGELERRIYVGDLLLRSRKRFGAFRHFTALAVAHGRPRHLLWALGGLLAPGLTQEHSAAIARRSIPAGWAAEADDWLARWRQTPEHLMTRPGIPA